MPQTSAASGVFASWPPLAEINTMPADDLDGSKTLRLDHAIRPLTPIPGSKLRLLGLD